MVFLEVRGLCKGFNGIQALDELDMSVRQGEIYGFLGPNGAGKTTTLRIIMGLVEVDRGKIRLEGEPITAVRRRDIGYLPEDVSLYEKMTVQENLMFFSRLKGFDKDEGQRVMKALRIEGLGDRKVETLSKGYQQKVGLAQVLIGDPGLLILDEPTSGLDPSVRRWLKDMMKNLKRQGKTILFSSHVLGEVQEICDRVGIISKGSMLTEDVFEDLTNVLDLEDRITVLMKPVKSSFKYVSELEGVKRPRIEGEYIVFYCSGVNKIKALRNIFSSDYRVLDVKLHEPDLEEVFVKLTEDDR